jgi:hypothetical protein
MKLAGDIRRLLLGTMLGTMLLTGCGREVEVPQLDEQTAEQKRQEYEAMIKKEQANR